MNKTFDALVYEWGVYQLISGNDHEGVRLYKIVNTSTGVKEVEGSFFMDMWNAFWSAVTAWEHMQEVIANPNMVQIVTGSGEIKH